MKTVISDNERGLLYKNGKLKKILGAGRYTTFSSGSIEQVSVLQPLVPECCTFDTLMALSGAKDKLIPVEVTDNEFCLHYLNGNFMGITSGGRYAF